MKKFPLFMLILTILIPFQVNAYSDYILASGENIGIELKANHIIIVGSYDVSGHNPLTENGLILGDQILKVNGKTVTKISDLQNIVNESNKETIEITYLRGNTEYTKNIKLYLEDGTYKTGLYVRDTIRGVATLTYIDVENKTFGALGHEILEKSTKSKFKANDGTIFKSTVTGIIKSQDGSPGEKNARSDSSKVYGEVLENTSSGIFGNYTSSIPKSKLYKVATSDEINLGKAKILTVIDDNDIREFDINILKINKNSTSKNILFEVTDEELLQKTGGIVQGMSGSPIIQGNNIVGAVNFVLVDKTNKGYGIFITKMLEEAEN